MRALDSMGGALPVPHGPRAPHEPASTGSVVNQLAAEKRAIERIPFSEQQLSWQEGRKFSQPVMTPGGEQVRLTHQREGQTYMSPQALLVGNIFDNYRRLQGGVSGTGMSARSLATLATESVRAPGMLPMATLAHKAAGVEFGLKGARVDDAIDRELGRRVLREHNPMEPKGSGRAAAQDYWTGRGDDAQAGQDTAAARNERRRRIWRVFSHIRRLVRQNKSLLGQEPALAEVAKNFEKWTQMNMPGAKSDSVQVQAAADRLEASIVAFMLTLK